MKKLIIISILILSWYTALTQTKGTGSMWYDLIHPQTFYVRENAVMNEVIGEINEITQHPDITFISDVGISYSTETGFDVVGNKLIITNTSLITGSAITVDVYASSSARSMVDTATMTVNIIPESNTIYIDPDWVGTESGTYAEPYNSWHDVTFTNNYYYLQKRGTTFSTSSVISISPGNLKQNIYLGSYGTDTARAKISSTAANGIHLDVVNSTIRDFEIDGNGSNFDAIRLEGIYGEYDTPAIEGTNYIDNCVIYDVQEAYILGYRTQVNCIMSNNIGYNSDAEGFWFKHNDTLILNYNSITSINQAGGEDAGGDGFQTAGYAGYIAVKNNIIKNDYAGWKHTMIIGGTSGLPADYRNMLIEGNLIVGLDSTELIHAHGLYVGASVDTLTARYNIFRDCQIGVFKFRHHARIYGNIFINNETPVSGNSYTLQDFYCYNNIFYQNRGIDLSAAATDTNVIKNNIHYSTSPDFIGYVSLYGPGTVDNNIYRHSLNIIDTKYLIEPTLSNLFVDAPNNNFHHADGSPAINYGASVDLDYDFEGFLNADTIDNGAFWDNQYASSWCLSNPISISGSVGNDTNSRGVGYVHITVSGGEGTYSYLWSNDSTTQNIDSLITDNYTVTITDDSSCTAYRGFYVDDIDTSTSIPIVSSDSSLTIDTVYSENDDGNVATNMLDDDELTRWSSDWIPARSVFVLDSIRRVKAVGIYHLNGTARYNYFRIYTSIDSLNWNLVLTDTSEIASEIVAYPVTFSNAKYVRIDGNGNSSNNWTSIIEFHIYGDSTMGIYNGCSIDTITDDFQNYTNNDSLSKVSNLYQDYQGYVIAEDVGGLLVATGSDGFNPDISYRADISSSDGLIRAQVIRTETNNFFGLIGRLNPDSNRFYGYLGWEDTIGVFKYTQAGGLVPLDTSSAGITNTDTLSMKIIGDSIWVYRNDTLDTSLGTGGKIIDSSIPGPGFWGFYIDDDFARLDNLEIISICSADTTDTLSYSITKQNVFCYGDSTGYISVNPEGGLPPYTHHWNVDSITSSISNLVPGNYTDTLKDANDSTLLVSVTIESFDSINIEYDVTDDKSYQNNGFILLTTVDGGIPPHTYSWDIGSSTKNIYNLRPGTYQITVFDTYNCSNTKTITVDNIKLRYKITIEGQKIKIPYKSKYYKVTY